MPASLSLHDLVERAASVRPDGPALESETTRLSYSQLLDQAAALAAELRAVGVGDEHVVAVDLEPGPRTVAAMLAASRCGAAFMPIDPREPAPRREAMFSAARPAAIVKPERVLAGQGGTRLDAWLPRRAGSAAYVSFTSGSTGLPKGVVTEQPAIVNYIEQVVTAYDLEPADRQLQLSSIAFDIAIDEIFSTLAAGAALIHRGTDFVFGDVTEFLARCHERGITVLNLPTGLWSRLGAELTDRPEVQLPADLRLIVVGGEAAQGATVSAWQRAATHPGFRMLNAYGPTEAAVSVTLAPLRAGRPVTIGKPLGGVTLELLGADGNPLADGEPGEIVIGGVAVGRGYLDQRRGGFGKIRGDWCYRTGDRARRGPSGDLEFVGRVDAQVKVRGGYRVEPGEVRAVLQAQPGVREAHVLPHARSGGRVLAAFVVAGGDVSVDIDTLRTRLAGLLPAWMVPWHLQLVDAVPLTDRGKVDHAALIGLLPDERDAPAVPVGDLRTAVVAAWKTALGRAPHSDDDSFFESGGDSLAALELIEVLWSDLGRAPTMSELLRAPTVAELVANLRPIAQADEVPSAHHTTGRLLVRMRRSGAGRLWCFLPPLSGAVTRYAAMARLLPVGDGVWAMETPAPLSAGGMRTLCDGLAAGLLREDLGSFDHIVLSGYSLGGVFAHEVARRVEAALDERSGPQPTVTAALLDPPDPAEPQMTLDDAFDIFVRVGWRIDEDPTSFVTEEGYDLAAVANAARRAGSLPAAASDQDVFDAWTVYAGNARILDDYVLSPGVGRTRLLECREDATVAVGAWAPSTHAGSWSTVMPATQTSVVAVEHFALMEPPHDRTVVRWLIEAASRAEDS